MKRITTTTTNKQKACCIFLFKRRLSRPSAPVLSIQYPAGLVWGGRREEGSGWGPRVYLWQIHVDVWQN